VHVHVRTCIHTGRGGILLITVLFSELQRINSIVAHGSEHKLKFFKEMLNIQETIDFERMTVQVSSLIVHDVI
jgi:hypothetical protein